MSLQIPTGKIFRSHPSVVTVGMINGETKTGLVNGFFQTAELVLKMIIKKPNGKMDEIEIRLASKEISYVAFHKGETPVTWPDDVELREFDIHLPGGKKFHVESDPSQVSHPIGFYAVPVSKYSQYSEIFFYSHGINAHEDKEPLGSIMVRNGIVQAEALEKGLREQTAHRNAPIGQILVEQEKVGAEDVEKAAQEQISRHKRGKHMRLGEILIEAGLANEDDILAAIEEQKKRKGKRIGEILVDLGIVDEGEVARALAAKFHLPFVDLDEEEVDPGAFGEIPVSMIKRYRLFPYQSDDHSIKIAIGDPLLLETTDMLKFSTAKRLSEVMVIPSQLESYLKTHFADREDSEALFGDIDDIMEQLESDAKGESELDSQVVDFVAASKDDTAVARLVNRIIIDAFRREASDIHIEPYGGSKATIVRFRVDGDCHIYQEIPAAYRFRLVSRIKILANLDITERRRPQDGKISFRLGEKNIELRVATMPTVFQNEDVVLRILAGGEPLPMAQIDFSASNLKSLKKIVHSPYGLIVVAGPTGSGKTTTLHSMMKEINVEERKIWTAEDPVEITQHGMRQVQVNPKIGFNFAAAMRSFLRADPDVIMVGEMRDAETAKISIEASLTGHLVCSTLHTNSAPETVTRLVDMGLDPFTFADALLCVVAQRLTRRLCVKCRIEYRAGQAEYDEICGFCGEDVIEKRLNGKPLMLRRAKGCEHCNDSGYKGRIGIHELLVNNEDLRTAIQHKATVDEILKIAQKNGMRTLLQDGIDKCLDGHTTLKQVLAVCIR
jgi:type II secretory ATPase GspE/PulE/Tfp pilus assembly ATPase PilB-like protein